MHFESEFTTAFHPLYLKCVALKTWVWLYIVFLNALTTHYDHFTTLMFREENLNIRIVKLCAYYNHYHNIQKLVD